MTLDPLEVKKTVQGRRKSLSIIDIIHLRNLHAATR
jgi:hypothetical protein